MNKVEYSGPALERAVAAKLRELLGSVSWLEGWAVERYPSQKDRRFDLRAMLPIGGRKLAELWVQCKADPRPSLFPYVSAASEADSQPVLVFAALYISPNMARTCEENGWSWFDLAGNCRLEIPGALLLERKGNEPVHEPPRPTANLSTVESARVIRALLVPENAGRQWAQREMQLHCQPKVSLGLVNKVFRHLRDEAFIESDDDGFRVRDPIKLLFAWRDAYRFDRHRQRPHFTLKRGPDLKQALASLESITGGHAAYCSFSAADFQAPHVRQPRTWLFIGAEWEEECAEALGAKLVDTGENLLVLIPDDLGVFYGQGSAGDDFACTNPVQTYVDLWHCGNRGQESAEALLEQKLKPEWKVQGLL
ncbi:MAG: type IV toxin-antitoxin system AbiEi family antitoxin [Verrucomicrobiota bacterium]